MKRLPVALRRGWAVPAADLAAQRGEFDGRGEDSVDTDGQPIGIIWMN